MVVLLVPLLETATVVVCPPATSDGTWKLNCCWPFTLSTANNGTAGPLIITESFRKVVGSGSEVTLTPALEVRLDPKMVATSPGTIPPPTKLAPSTTPSVLITGPVPVTLMLTTEYSVLSSAEPKATDACAEPSAIALPVTVTVMLTRGASEEVEQLDEVGGEGRLAQVPLELETPAI
jgi:hypothetical protein